MIPSDDLATAITNFESGAETYDDRCEILKALRAYQEYLETKSLNPMFEVLDQFSTMATTMGGMVQAMRDQGFSDEQAAAMVFATVMQGFTGGGG